MEIFLKNKKGKKSVKGNSFLSVSLKTDKMLLPSTSIDSILNLKEQYNKEREECNIIRLVCTINPLCSNVLFNNLTEVIFDEGSENPVSMNYITTKVLKQYLAEQNVLTDKVRVYGLNMEDDTIEKTYIQDTQLSRYDRLNYHCGLDIFNNHLIRSNTYKGVTLPESINDLGGQNNAKYFNTIRDYLRDYHGVNKTGYSDLLFSNENNRMDRTPATKMHVYLGEDIDSFKTAVSTKIHENNGWIGFKNIPQITTYDSNQNAININKPINNEASCGFIDLYPERDLYYFTPKYNQYRHRIEKNWNYCITYPSSSTTEGISFINSIDDLNALRIAVYDDSTENSNGIESIYICSTCKHGLVQGDVINVYETLYEEEEGKTALENSHDETNGTNLKIINGAFVNEIVDDYSFYITKSGYDLSGVWMDFDTFLVENAKVGSERLTALSETYKEQTTYVYYPSTVAETSRYYCPIINKKINLYEYSKNFSFKKVVNSVECDYYVRIFSRIPNWKYSDTKPSEYELYKDGSELISKNQQLSSETESHIGKLAFATNIYGDDVSEIVFTDDIDLSYLKDNLGRPLSNLYLTILKNNSGYKDWYKNCVTGTVNNFKLDETETTLSKIEGYTIAQNEIIEYSHCFGKLINNFELSVESLINPHFLNVKRSNLLEVEDGSKNCSSGLSYTAINQNRPSNYTADEVVYDYYDTKNADSKYTAHTLGDVNFYGDVVCFSPSEYLETTLEMSSFRFNTAQRELVTGDGFLATNDGKLYYDEILHDDYDYNSSAEETKQPFECKTYDDIGKTISVCHRKEGYFYQGHYEIPIKTFSTTLNSQQSKIYNPVSINRVLIESKPFYIIKTMEKSYLELYDKFGLYNVTLSDDTSIKEDDKYCFLTVTKIKDRHTIYAKVDIEPKKEGYRLVDTYTNKFKLFKPDETVPNYAILLKDKTFNYVWREIKQNGFDTDSDIEEYPFTNGALYPNKFINFFLKRQDPDNYVKDYAWDGCAMESNEYPYDMEMKNLDADAENNYYEEDDILC